MAVFQGYGGEQKPKRRVAVEIVTEDGAVQGHLFLNPNERVIDMMNDQRGYVAFEHGDGMIEIISKGLVKRIRPVDQARPDGTTTVPLMPGT